VVAGRARLVAHVVALESSSAHFRPVTLDGVQCPKLFQAIAFVSTVGSGPIPSFGRGCGCVYCCYAPCRDSASRQNPPPPAVEKRSEIGFLGTGSQSVAGGWTQQAGWSTRCEVLGREAVLGRNTIGAGQGTAQRLSLQIWQVRSRKKGEGGAPSATHSWGTYRSFCPASKDEAWHDEGKTIDPDPIFSGGMAGAVWKAKERSKDSCCLYGKKGKKKIKERPGLACPASIYRGLVQAGGPGHRHRQQRECPTVTMHFRAWIWARSKARGGCTVSRRALGPTKTAEKEKKKRKRKEKEEIEKKSWRLKHDAAHWT